MAVDKTLEVVYDLASINEAQASELIKANEEVIKKAQDQKTKSKKKSTSVTAKQSDKIDKKLEKLKKQIELDLVNGKGKDRLGEKLFGRKTFDNLLSLGSNPIGFGTGLITKLIPFIGTALLVTGVIAEFVKRVDDFQKEFVDNVDGRINLFRSKEQQALVQAGLQQLIITTSAGSAEPRDAYNTFNEFNTNKSRIETDFQVRNTSGVN